MTRYIRRPARADYVWRDSDDVWLSPADAGVSSLTVFEPEDRQTFSGLYDADGTPLYRDDYRPIGFLRGDD